MNFVILRTSEFILCLTGIFASAEGYDKSWRRYKETDIPSLRLQFREATSKSPKGLALTGYLASLMDYSFVVSYHYKESGRLFCSGFLISPYWTISVPNCFRIPIYYYRNKKTLQVRKRRADEYPYGSLSLKESLTVKPKEYSEIELKELNKIVALKPEAVVVLTVFDKVYIPCESEHPRTGSRIIIHSSYKTISHNAEIALLKVSDALTDDFALKIPNIEPLSIKSDEPNTCHVVGYGLLKLNRTYYSRPMLSVIDVEVFPPKICQTISKTYNETIDADPSNYVCSYNTKYRYGSPLSQGDSGAPLICGEKIVGLSQWVFSPAPAFLSYGPSQPTPHIYTRLDVYWPWILKHMNKKVDDNFSVLRKKVHKASVVSSLNDCRILILVLFLQYYLYNVYYNTS